MSNDKKPDGWRRQTNLVRGGLDRSHFDEISEAMYLTSSYAYESAEQAQRAFKGEEDHYLYSRYGNPTVTQFEERMKLMEGAQICQSTASGMGAVFASLACMLGAGGRLVASKALFGSCDYVCTVLMPQYGVETVTVASTDLDEWERALSKPTKAVFLETPSNPMMQILDIEAIAELAHKAGARLIVDNVFATPIYQHPLQLGADIVMYSTTKHIDGQGRCLGGVVLASEEWIDENLHDYYRHTGPAMSPFNAWVMLKGLETLPLRVKSQTATASKAADFLAERSEVKRVIYPGRPDHPQANVIPKQMKGGSTLVCLELKGGKKEAFAFSNALKVVKISNNLGDAKSLITHPATTTHKNLTPEARAELGISDGTLRLSIGLEDEADLLNDLDAALSATR